MLRKKDQQPADRRARIAVRLLVALGCGLVACWGTVRAGDLLRGGAVSSPPSAAATAPGGPSSPRGSALGTPSQDRLARTTQALEAVKQMQVAARNLAVTGPNSLRAGLPAVPVNSYGQANGLRPATGVDKLWIGANQPVETSQVAGGTTSTTVTIKQLQQQALLTWESFNIGKSTTLTYDQSAGGTNAGQWIAFNYVRDPTGAPSQILGAIKTIGLPGAGGAEQVGGQVYVMNANGIIFGGSSQVNVHALVASSLPVNHNLIQRGILNNPDAQFLFTALAQPAGSKGPTPAFDPAVATEGLGPVQTPFTVDGSYGHVEVQAGAQLTAPTNADQVGGRIALVGPHVTNLGTISTPDGQAIIAAGLQVGFAAHATGDPTLRGLDVYVGAVTNPAGTVTAGTATNDRIVNSDGSVYTGLISAPRGAVTLTGKTVNQRGFIDSSTSISYNGRVDLIAGYNAVANPKYDPSSTASDFTLSLPFFYQSNVGNIAAGAAVANTGPVTLGAGSVVRILPDTASTARAPGDLALLSQVNIQGQAIHLEADATVLAPGAAVPLNKAYGFDGRPLEAGVSLRAGTWYNPADTRYNFVHTDDAQQIYLEKGAAIDVAGLGAVTASVTDNIVAVELRGSELADSPLQRDSPLRGQTVQVDLRQHGPWDPTLNGGLGGYTWVGTPLGNTSGWVGLTQHTVGQLSVNGGSVTMKAGGAVVLQKDAMVDVSGGFIDFAGGFVTTTKLIADGHVYDIAKATPDRKYTGIQGGITFTIDEKWGAVEASAKPLAQAVYESGYRQGGSAGSLAVTAPVLALDGTLRGRAAAAGPAQRNLSAAYNPTAPPDPANPVAAGVNRWLLDALNRPLPGQFSLTVGRQYLSPSGNFARYSPKPANIVLGTVATDPVAVEAFKALGDYSFPKDRDYGLTLAPALFGSGEGDGGFALVKIDNSDDALGLSPGYGNITAKAGTTLTLLPGGGLTLSAANVTVEKNAVLTAPGGSLVFNAYTISPSVAEKVAFLSSTGPVAEKDVPVYNPLRGTVTIATGAVLSTAGSVVDDRVTNPAAGTVPQVTTGGSIVLNGSEVALKAGSALTVSGGAVLGSTGKLAYGDAGNITLKAGRGLTGGNEIGTIVGGRLSLAGAVLEGFSGTGRKGGKLTLEAPSVQIAGLTGGATAATSAAGALTLAPGFFNDGGFTQFSVTGLGVELGTDGHMAGAAPSFTVVPNVVVDATARSWETLPGGVTTLAPAGLRRAVGLEFKTSGLFSNVNRILLDNRVDFSVGAGAVLATDPGGSVALGGGSIDLLGRITARGGSITVTQTGVGSQFAFLPGLHLGTGSVLDVSGTTTYTQDLTGYHKAEVLDGGAIVVSGNLVAEKGARLSVAGASDSIQVKPGPLPNGLPTGTGADLVAVTKDSNGGKLTLQGEQVLFTAATLEGAAGGATARGGELVVVSNAANYDFLIPRANADGTTDPRATQVDPVLRLTAKVPDFVYKGIGKAVTNTAGQVYGDVQGLGLIRFGAESVANGGFGALALGTAGRGAVQVEGAVALTASRQITVADGGVLAFGPAAGDPVGTIPGLTLSAPYVVLGQPFQPPQQALSLTATPVNGAGQLQVSADTLIDVGSLVLQGAGTAGLDATHDGSTRGAIRGNGTLNVAGNILLRAGQVYPPTGTTFNVIASDYTKTGDLVATPGSVVIQSGLAGAAPALPLAAGGSLNIYASEITQGGVLRAPLGQVRLGSDNGAGVNPHSGASLPVTASLTLLPGSITSVSALDPVTGKPVEIPYGIAVNGDTWIDPAGADITSIGPGAKSITLTADKIDFQAATTGQAAATLDLQGGGNLTAYQFVPGAGGTKDILLGTTATGFAIVPGYADTFAPFAAYSTGTEALLNLGADPGYVVGNAKLDYKVGDRIHLEAGGGLPAGDYTLLPARYALSPGAYLITPQSTAVTGGAADSVTRFDGASLVAGYRYNALDGAGKTQALFRTFELAPQSVVKQRTEYQGYAANVFFRTVAELNDTVAPRLPVDAGRLGLSVGADLRLKGSVLSQAATGGRGGLIDLSSTADILIGSQAVITALNAAGPSGTLLLEAKLLTSFGAESLFIGGTRTTDANGTTATVRTNRITVDNAGEALSGTDVILAANQSLTLKDNAEIGGAGLPAILADPLTVNGTATLGRIGDSISFARGGTPISLPGGTPGTGRLTATSSGTVTTASGTKSTFLATTSGLANAFTVPAGGTVTLDTAGAITLASSTDLVVKSVPLVFGDGVLLRVGSDPAAIVTRGAVAGTVTPALNVGPGVRIIGGSAIFDSTRATDMSGGVDLSAVRSLSLNSGRISLLLDQPGGVATTDSLVLSRPAQESMFKSVTALSLLSYSTLDLYGTGTFGSATLESLALHAGAIQGILLTADPAASTTLLAKHITLDNAANVAAPAVPVPPVAGRLVFDAGTLQLGGNQLEIQNYAAVVMNAANGILTGDTAKTSAHSGGLTVKGGALTVTTPLLAGAGGTDQSITAEGNLAVLSGTSPATVSPGLGASLHLTGKDAEIASAVRLPSGNLTVTATAGKLAITGGSLDVSGTVQQFYEATRYTDGGQINLAATTGDLTVVSGSRLAVAAAAGGGSAGLLTVQAPQGNVSLATGTLDGHAGAGGQGGSFRLDALGLAGATVNNLAPLLGAITDGGLSRSVDLRLREGDVAVDGLIRAHEFALAADHGSITVSGSIDASGLQGSTRDAPLGGTIDAADPTGGKISLAASGSVILTPSAWLTAAGYAYNNAGKGGAIYLSAGGYATVAGVGQVNPAGVVDVQSGARLDLGVKNNFTPNDLLLNPGVAQPVSNRTDFVTGTLHVREPQVAFGSGTQFGGLAGAVGGASALELEGFQVFDLTGTSGAGSTTGSITTVNSGGLIDLAVEQAVRNNGTAFLAGVNPTLLASPLVHIRPGAEIVNNATVASTTTRNFVTLNSSVTATRSLVNFTLKPGTVSVPVFTTTLIPGGLPFGVTLRLGPGQTRTLTLTTADGVTSAPATFTATTDIKSASATNPIVAINLRNTGSAQGTQLNFFAGTTPLTLALDTATTITSVANAGRYASQSGDLVLANTWDLSTFRYGTQLEPGNLTLRAKGNLIFGFDASLSDGFDPANPVSATNPLWTAQLQGGNSSSYRLVAGAEYAAADSRVVQPLGTTLATRGSVLIGTGALALPTTTGSSVTRESVIPRFYQTIRTGTGDIELVAARDVQFLNPLATVYTAGRRADPLLNFDVPVLNSTVDAQTAAGPYYSAQYSRAGGDVTIRAQSDIARYILSGTALVPNSSREMPSNWLYRRGNVGEDGRFAAYAGTNPPSTEVQSTTWWIDFSNFFADTGALGGGNVSLTAGRNVSNINAAAPTNARMPGRDTAGLAMAPDAGRLVEQGGGNVVVRAGADIDGGVYYTERGEAVLRAGGMVKTNSTRWSFVSGASTNPVTWLPTTFFLGKGRVDVAASGDIRLGSVANPFWLLQGTGNRVYDASYFSTFDPHNQVQAASLGGTITVQVRPDVPTVSSIGTGASLATWYTNVFSQQSNATAAAQPWLRLGARSQSGLTPVNLFQTVGGVLPAKFEATAFGGNIDVVGRLTLAPSPTGSLDLLAAGSINGLRINGVSGANSVWGTAAILLSDADPARLPGVAKPLGYSIYTTVTPITLLAAVDALFADSGRSNFSLEEKLALHGQAVDSAGKPVPLHYNDTQPLRLYAAGGDLSGLTLYSAKSARVIAGHDVTDVALYVQNVRAGDSTVVAAGHDVIAYDPDSPLRVAARQPGNTLSGTAGETGPAGGTPTTGDLQIAGPGTLQVLAGRNLDLGNGSNVRKDGTAVGITSVGATRNPQLPQNSGANIIAVAGAGRVYTPAAAALGQAPGLASTDLDFARFIDQFLRPDLAGATAERYLPVLGQLMGLAASTDPAAVWTAFAFTPGRPLTEKQAGLVLGIFNLVLRDSARDLADPDRPFTTKYANGFAAIAALFPGSPEPTEAQLGSKDPVARPEGPWAGQLTMPTRLVKTVEGGDITLLVPGGSLTVGRGTDPQKPDQGVLTERGGAISIFAADSVNVGTSRIFTLRGGDETIWATWGNIAAGSGSKTVFSAPPTRVLVDPQSGDVQNDLAGLATGSGIGVLATLSGVKPGDVDLIAPVGTIDAGDAGIRSSGNVHLSAPNVLNAGNIDAGGTTSGTPPPPPAPNIGALSAASTASAGSSSAATEVAKQANTTAQVTELPSLISVEVLGYGGEDEEDGKDPAVSAAATGAGT